MSVKGSARTLFEEKTAEQFSSSQYEAISRSLDEFCSRAIQENNNLYQQIIFQE